MFQAIDEETFIKIDLHPGEDVPGELGRSVKTELLPGITARVVCREDSILSKLIWIRNGSHKSRQDVTGMLIRSGGVLNWNYLNHTSATLGVSDLLRELLNASGGN